MMKLAIVIWIVLGTVLAGVATTVILVTPGLEAMTMRLFPAAAALGFVLAIPVSIMVAKQLYGGAAATR